MDLYMPPLPSVFLGTMLQDDVEQSFATNIEAARHVKALALADLGGKPILQSTPENDLLLARMMATDTAFVINRSGDAASSMNWYTDAIDRTIKIAAVLFPEIDCDEEAKNHSSGFFARSRDARTVLFAAMAITSQNNSVHDNMRYAVEQYRHFLANGRFQPKVYGANGAAVKHNLQRFNDLYETANGDLSRIYRMLTMRLKMKDLKRIAARYDIDLPAKELADETVYGSMIFGPKVGNGFMQNLFGNHDPITIDMWFMRSWGRYTGTLIRDEVFDNSRSQLVAGLRRAQRSARMTALMTESGVARDPGTIWSMDDDELGNYARQLKFFWEKLRRHYVAGKLGERYAVIERPSPSADVPSNVDASALKARLMWPSAVESIMRGLGSTIDSPRNASTRAWMKRVVQMALEILAEAGYSMTAADLQATLWYPEKELYGRLTGRAPDRIIASYDEAMISICRKEGISDAEIEAALSSMVGRGRDRPGVSSKPRDGITGSGESTDGRVAGTVGRGRGSDLGQFGSVIPMASGF